MGSDHLDDAVVGGIGPAASSVQELDSVLASLGQAAQRATVDRNRKVDGLHGGQVLEAFDESAHRPVAIAPPAVWPSADYVQGVNNHVGTHFRSLAQRWRML